MYSYEAPKRPKSARGAAAAAAVTLARDFCLETSMHGFRHVAAPGSHWIERVVWIAATVLAIWGAVHVSLGQLQRYHERPTVVTIEKDFRSWQFSLPAVTACHKNRTDPSKLEKVIRDIWNVGSYDEKYGYYSRFVRAVTDSDLLSLGLYEEFAQDSSLEVDLFQLAVDVKPDPDIKTTVAEKKFEFVKWIPVMTEFGACYSVNSVAVKDTALVNLHRNDTILYPLTCKYGGTTSCLIMLEVYDHYDFYCHSPYDIVDVTMSPEYAHFSHTLTVDLSVVETTCGRGVEELSAARRHCLYNDEPVAGRAVYSTNACRQTCRSKLALDLCKCVPFYYFYDDGPVCSTSGMVCLAQYANNLTVGHHKCTCGTPQCLYSVFREINRNVLPWGVTSPFAGQSGLKYVVQTPKIRYTREIVFHFQDLVVSFGGAAGLFLGASFISFVEVVYFLLERVLRAVSSDDTKPPTLNENERKDTYEEQRMKELTAILEHSYKHGRNSRKHNY